MYRGDENLSFNFLLQRKMFFASAVTCCAVLTFQSLFIGAQTPEEIAAWIDLPAKYQTLTATEKANLLWNKVKESKYTNLPSWEAHKSDGILQLLKTGFSLAPAFTCNTHNSDVMPVDRVRLANKLAVVGRVKWTMLQNVKQNNFTGLLANGASTAGLIRLSLANSNKQRVRPGMGLKLFIDGRPSVNTVGNVALDGQGSNKNYFLRPFRTVFAEPKSLKTDLVEQEIVARFEQIESPARLLPVRDFARFTADGEEIKNASYPFMLELRPVERIKNLIAEDSDKDTREDLMRVLSPGPLYDIYAAGFLDDPNAFKIGELTLEANVLASEFGDKKLCFKHQRHHVTHDEL